MRSSLLIPSLLAVLIVAPLQAQTDTAREFKQLIDQREAAAAAALAPINKRHVDALTQLLTRATRNGDLDTAVKARTELEKYGVKVAAGALGATVAPAVSQPTSLNSQLRDTKWQLSGGKTFTLHADGTSTSSWTPRKGSWKVTGPNAVDLSVTNTPTIRKSTVNPERTRISMKGAPDDAPEVATLVKLGNWRTFIAELKPRIQNP